MGIFLNLGQLKPNAYEKVFNDIWLSLKDQFLAFIKQFYKYESMGSVEKAKKALMCANKVMFLMYYVLLMKIDTEEKINNGQCFGTEDSSNYLNDNFKIDCVRKEMACMGIDLDKVLAAAEISPYLTGIGYMALEEGCEIFEIS